MEQPKFKIQFLEGGESPRENITIEVFANQKNLIYIGLGDDGVDNYMDFQCIVLDKETAKAFSKELNKAIKLLP
jgi:hypothetical protein